MMLGVLLGLFAVQSIAFRVPILIPSGSRFRLSATRYLDMTTTSSSLDLSTIGSDIVIAPASEVSRIIMKFGGSSLANAERVTYVARLIQKHVESGYKPTIVCSAMGKTTNSLLSAGDFALTGQV
jgi:hypothetical protein